MFIMRSKMLFLFAALAVTTTSCPSIAWETMADYLRHIPPNPTSDKAIKEIDHVVNYSQACWDKHDSAKNSICSNKNEGIQTATTAVGALVRGADAAVSMNIQMACSKFGNVARMAHAALTAYELGCLVAQKNCDKECKEASSAISDRRSSLRKACSSSIKECSNEAETQKIATALNAVGWLAKGVYNSTNCDPVVKAAANCKEEINALEELLYERLDDDKGGVSKIASSCTGLKQNMGLVATDLMGLLGSYLAAKQCEELMASASPTDYCTANPTDPLCANDCQIEPNKSSARCICLTNPQDPICGGTALTSLGGQTGLGTSGALDGSLAATDPSLQLGNIALPGGGDIEPVKSGGANKLATSPNSGGGGGGAGGKGGGPSANSPTFNKRGGGDDADANISGGGAAGGGGGAQAAGAQNSEGRRDRDRDRDGDRENRDKNIELLKSFLPGGKNAAQDGSRITRANGLTNWEKVSNRYQANQPSLDK